MKRSDKYYDLITSWGQDKKTEIEIVNKLASIIKASEPDDIDLYYDINDALHWHGYSYQFEVPKGESFKLDMDKYFTLISNVTKSKTQTNELMNFLWESNDWRLTLNSLKFIKMKHLLALGVYKQDFMQQYDKYTLYDLYMMTFSPIYDSIFNGNREYVHLLIEKLLKMIGMPYVDLNYMEFRMKMEYLLWTITKVDNKKDSYLKVNTLKVAFSIAPREYFLFNGKAYYNENIQKNVIKYLGLIDKNEAKRIYDEYIETIDLLDNTGYKLLFNML